MQYLNELPSEDLASLPLRQLLPQMQPVLLQGVIDGSALYRDRLVMLRAVDERWVRHLTDLDFLREGIGLRAYGQVQPLVAYKKEAFAMYEGVSHFHRERHRPCDLQSGRRASAAAASSSHTDQPQRRKRRTAAEATLWSDIGAK